MAAMLDSRTKTALVPVQLKGNSVMVRSSYFGDPSSLNMMSWMVMVSGTVPPVNSRVMSVPNLMYGMSSPCSIK